MQCYLIRNILGNFSFKVILRWKQLFFLNSQEVIEETLANSIKGVGGEEREIKRGIKVVSIDRSPFK